MPVANKAKFLPPRRDVHRHFEEQGLKWKKYLLHFYIYYITLYITLYLFYIYYTFFLNKTLNILGMCNIDKKYIIIFWDFINNDKQCFADCVIVLIS